MNSSRKKRKKQWFLETSNFPKEYLEKYPEDLNKTKRTFLKYICNPEYKYFEF